MKIAFLRAKTRRPTPTNSKTSAFSGGNAERKKEKRYRADWNGTDRLNPLEAVGFR